MIDERSYIEVLDSGLLLDHYFLLCSIKNGRKLPNRKRIQGFVNLLNKKGYLDGDELTSKGIDLVQNCGFAEIIEITEEKKKEEIDFGTWIRELHSSCQAKLINLTGKKQITGKVNKTDKKGYPFLPNETDLGKVLWKVTKEYKLNDYAKIKDTLLKYIEECYHSNSWLPIMQYYILKFGQSRMVTDMNKEETTEVVVNTKHKIV